MNWRSLAGGTYDNELLVGVPIGAHTRVKLLTVHHAQNDGPKTALEVELNYHAAQDLRELLDLWLEEYSGFADGEEEQDR